MNFFRLKNILIKTKNKLHRDLTDLKSLFLSNYQATDPSPLNSLDSWVHRSYYV